LIAIAAAVLAFLFVYFVVGTLVRYNKGLRRFPEVLPNYRFWRSLALGIADLFLCLVTCGKKRTGAKLPENDRAVLPSCPERSGARERFEQLPAEFDDFDEEEAMKPSVVVEY